MATTIIGLLLLHGGYIALIVGIVKNRSFEEQFLAMLQKGVSNPGNIWMLVGAVAIFLGTLIVILGAARAVKKNKKPKYY